jgi:DNA replication and repair protein RecF
VAAARRETVSRLAAQIVASESVFPWAEVAIEGEIEGWLAEAPALAVEERFREALAQTRRRDAAAGRTLTGPQTSDLAVRHGPKNEAARDCSTGEQKALLMGLTLAHARLVGEMTGKAPLLLLDEVAAHFDPIRREALFAELETLGGQVWMTGADPLLFDSLRGRADIMQVTPGRIERL